MRRTYAVTVVMQMEEPQSMAAGSSEIQDALNKQFAISAIQMRLRDMFKGGNDFNVTGVVILECARVLP